jgi:ATP-dependent DNA helicase RecG
MAGEVFSISDEQIERVLSYGEGHFGDLKAIDIRPSKMSETISSFANADGGELYIGVDEELNTGRRSWRGFQRVEDANAHLQVLNELFPLGATYSFDFLQHSRAKGFVLHLEIAKARSIVRATDGTPYVRRGAQNLPVNTDEKLRLLERNKGITSYETETIKLDPAVITNSLTAIRFMLDVVPTAEPSDWLRKQQVIVEDLPTVAGLVLFSDEPQAALPKRCGIKVYRYASTAAEGARETLSGDPISIEGNAYEVIHTAVRKTQEIIGNIPRLGQRGLEEVSYPPETLHEIITNAVLHRDYSLPDDIHVRIFDNRVEVESPGLLPGHITEQNILSERFARNGMIVRLINKFPNPPNKDVGEGLNTAFAAMKKMRLREPEIKQAEHSVIVYIRHTRLASPEDAVMDYLANNNQITNTIGRDLTGVRSDATMKNVFVRLRERNLIELIPGTRGRNSAWRKLT